MRGIIKGSIKYIFLAIIACVGAVAIYNIVVPKENRIPIGIVIK